MDDSLGVKAEGERYGFTVIHIAPDDLHWAEKIQQQLVSNKPISILKSIEK
jgi:hypothetical protein